MKDERERRRKEQEREWEASYAKYMDTWATHDGNARARAFSKISSDEDSNDDEKPRAASRHTKKWFYILCVSCM